MSIFSRLSYKTTKEKYLVRTLSNIISHDPHRNTIPLSFFYTQGKNIYGYTVFYFTDNHPGLDTCGHLGSYFIAECEGRQTYQPAGKGNAKKRRVVLKNSGIFQHYPVRKREMKTHLPL